MTPETTETNASSPPIRTRLFWTWDHSTEWALNRGGAQTIGANNPYSRTTDTFIEDYTRLLTWCGQHRIDGVVVWGLLRDCHGGVDAARRLCDVARESGVRLLAGTGLNAYGGTYYEGDSPHSLIQHLEQYPDLYAVDAEGRPMRDLAKRTHIACPSRPENQEFAADSLRWLMESVALGGVQIETGDTGVCQCRLCRDRRRHPAGVLSWEDMALMYPLAADAVRAVAPDAWIVCETYSHPQPFAGPAEAPGFADGKPPWADACMAQFPKDVFVQWVADKHMSPKNLCPWTDAAAVDGSERRHVMRAHFATYWYGQRGELALDWIAEMVGRSVATGCNGVSLFGEVSSFHTGAELNYLALENFGSERNPDADVDVFLRDVAAPLLGGEGAARNFLRYAVAGRSPGDREALPAAVSDIYRRVAALPGAAARRWTWLANYLASLMKST